MFAFGDLVPCNFAIIATRNGFDRNSGFSAFLGRFLFRLNPHSIAKLIHQHRSGFNVCHRCGCKICQYHRSRSTFGHSTGFLCTYFPTLHHFRTALWSKQGLIARSQLFPPPGLALFPFCSQNRKLRQDEFPHQQLCSH